MIVKLRLNVAQYAQLVPVLEKLTGDGGYVTLLDPPKSDCKSLGKISLTVDFQEVSILSPHEVCDDAKRIYRETALLPFLDAAGIFPAKKTVSSFKSRLASYLLAQRGKSEPLITVEMQEVAPGVINVLDDQDNFNTYFDRAVWEFVHADVWATHQHPTDDIGVLPEMGRCPKIATFDAARYYAEEHLKHRLTWCTNHNIPASVRLDEGVLMRIVGAQ